MSVNAPPEPWHSFLMALDALAEEKVYLRCLGGFVIYQLYGLPRTTSDVDTLLIDPSDKMPLFLEKAGKGSELHKTHKVYLDIVTVADYPDSYEDRLTELFAGTYKNLRIAAFEIYDLVLAKLCRNNPRDREDVTFLANRVPLDTEILMQRYKTEMRGYLATQDREDATIALWIDIIKEQQAKHS
jgi:hypothetical protein